METTVRQEKLDYGLFDRVAQAALWLKAHRPPPARIRIVADDDSDGTTSAFVLSNALLGKGYEVDLHLAPVHNTQDVDVGMGGTYDAYFVADCGSAFLEYLDSFAVPTIVLDHHRVVEYEPRNVFEVNPRRLGGDQVDFVSASVVSQVFASHLDAENRTTAFAAVAGGIADRQHLSGFNGLIDHLIDEAVAAGHTTRQQGLTLPGRTLTEAIADSIDPYFDGLTGDEDATRAFLTELGLAPEQDPRAVEEAAARRLGDVLNKRLQDKGVVTARVYPVFGLMLPLSHPSRVPTLFALTRILETLTARDDFAQALAVLDGDAKAAEAAWQKHRERTREVLAEVDRMRAGVEERDNVRVAESKDELDTGIYAHTLLTYVYGDDKPFLAFTRSGGKVKFSARGSPSLYNAGVDLSIGMKEAAEAFGGNGGGHPGASGAAVPKKDLEGFLEKLDASLGRLRKEKGAA